MGYCCKWILLAAACAVRITLTAEPLVHFPGWSSCTTLFALAGAGTAVRAASGPGLFQPQHGAKTPSATSETSLGLLWAGRCCAEESGSGAGYGVAQDERLAPLCTCGRALRVCGEHPSSPSGGALAARNGSHGAWASRASEAGSKAPPAQGFFWRQKPCK